jgi:hypothetical protein
MSSAVARNDRQWELCSTENRRNKGHSYRFGTTPTVDYSLRSLPIKPRLRLASKVGQRFVVRHTDLEPFFFRDRVPSTLLLYALLH